MKKKAATELPKTRTLYQTSSSANKASTPCWLIAARCHVRH